MNQGLCEGGPKAANHICQSRRGWWGTTMGGGRLMFPGLYMNSISCPAEPSQMTNWTWGHPPLCTNTPWVPRPVAPTLTVQWRPS